MAILPPKRYVRQDFKIPFYDSSSKLYRVKAKVSPKINNQDDLRTSIDDLREEATVYYIAHYLPEFYTYLYNPSAFELMLPEGEGLGLAEDLIGDIKRSITVENYFAPPPPDNTRKSIAIFKTSYDFFEKREELTKENKMPSFEANQVFFREKNAITDPTSGTTLSITSLGGQNNVLNEGLQIFNQVFSMLEAQLTINIDFNFVQNSVQTILNLIVGIIRQRLKRTSGKKLTDADTITLQFGSKSLKPAVVGIEYLLAEESIQTAPLKIGNFSSILYNNAFSNPMTVAVLQNYRNIADGAAAARMGRESSFSFYDFINDDSVISTLTPPATTSLHFLVIP